MNPFRNFFLRARFRFLSRSLERKGKKGDEVPEKCLDRFSFLLSSFPEGSKERKEGDALLERARRRNEGIRKANRTIGWFREKDIRRHPENMGEEEAKGLEELLLLLEKVGFFRGSDLSAFLRTAKKALSRRREYLEQKGVYEALEENLRDIFRWKGYLSSRSGEPFRLKAANLRKKASSFGAPCFSFPSGEEVEEAVVRGNDLAVYIARTGKLLADAKYHLNEKKKSEVFDTLRETASRAKATSKAVNAIIDSLCKEEQYLVDWCERLNRAATHQLEWCRTVISKAKAEMTLAPQNYNNPKF